MLRCSPAEGLVWHLCGTAAEKGTSARSAGTHLDVAAWETRSVGLFGGRGTGRSSWCCRRAWKSKPTPSHVRPSWLAGWRNGSPFPSAPGLLPGSCSGNPFGGALGGQKGLLRATLGRYRGHLALPLLRKGSWWEMWVLLFGYLAAKTSLLSSPPATPGCLSPFLKSRFVPAILEQRLIPLHRSAAQSILPTSARWGAPGYLLTWRGSRGQMQSKRAFHQVRHRLNICWAPWAAWKSVTASQRPAGSVSWWR